MQRLKVGAPLQVGVTGYKEGVHYNYTPGGHTLLLSMKDPDISDITEVQQGQPVFALGTVDEVMLFLARFGKSPWRLAHYNWWLNPAVMRPDPLADLRRLKAGVYVSVCLVNASSGLVQALRAVRLTRDFSISLLGRVELQKRHPLDPWHYLDVVERINRDYQDGSTMITDALCVCSADLEPVDHVTAPPSSLWH